MTGVSRAKNAQRMPTPSENETGITDASHLETVSNRDVSIDSRATKKSDSNQSVKLKSCLRQRQPVLVSPTAASKQLPAMASQVEKDSITTSTKHSIIVETSRARSNLEVVRSCLHELGWREVRRVRPVHPTYSLSLFIAVHFGYNDACRYLLAFCFFPRKQKQLQSELRSSEQISR